MLIKMRRSWELPEHLATPESAWLGRRQLLRMAAAGPILAASAPALLAGCDDGGSGTAVAEEGPGVPPRHSIWMIPRPISIRLRPTRRSSSTAR